jgi:hypothetical protein
MLYLPHIRALRGRQLSSHAVSIPHNAIIWQRIILYFSLCGKMNMERVDNLIIKTNKVDVFWIILSISNCVKELLNNFINAYAYIGVYVNRYTCLIIHVLHIFQNDQ